ncbi:MAG: DUF3576 domain-containing protein [Paracoccaceae bacterium]
MTGEKITSRAAPVVALLCAGLLLGCGSGSLRADGDRNDPAPGSGTRRDQDFGVEGKLFGDDLNASSLLDGTLFSGGNDQDGDALPVNKFLWQASLDTLSFMPLASTDPFTGVIATEWSTSPSAPGERFKVTVYLIRPALEASSLRVAVFREARSAEGVWIPQPVSTETIVRLENAILTRARQIRIAGIEAEEASG